MPTGKYKRTPEMYEGRAKASPTCLCGQCKLCKQRETNRAWRKRQRSRETDCEQLTDEELERRMVQKFREKGWD